MQDISLPKYLLVSAIGFGLGGAVWGWSLYKNLNALETIFDLKIAILFGLIGGICLVLFSKNIKQIIKIGLLGITGWVIGFIVGSYGFYFLFIWGSIAMQLILKQNPLGYLFAPIGNSWLAFAVVGSIVGLFYGLLFKMKAWSVIWRVTVGFSFGSLIGSVIGNLLENSFNSIFINYTVTFALIGITLGIFWGWGIYKNLKTN